MSSSSPQKRPSEQEESNNKKQKIEDTSNIPLPEVSSSQQIPHIPSEPPSSAVSSGSQLAVPPLITPSLNFPDENRDSNLTKEDDKDDDDKGLAKPTAPADPDKLSDALVSAGIDVKAEEALLNERSNKSKSNDPDSNKPIVKNTPFLDERQLAAYMNKVLQVNGFKQQTLESDTNLLQLVTYACEDWMKNLVTNAIVISRHRRRAIKNNRKRSETSKSLRDLSIQQKQLEDRRQARKKDSGIELEEGKKQDSDATQHIATNATVAMMTGKKSKKYSWMTGGSNKNSNNSNGKSSGENAIRFREAREEPGIAVRDLLTSLEKKRIGVKKTLVKGYAKLKD
ncbi:hypothetical protein WICMUC_004330 [Wickerhamomyces mucosus]|uniref:Transcription initiation factor TFIID subunit 4 n=1 Tax=Wickerhamomyces mucosus TaxID=1378264 RepID=A0A9P8PHC7_9ASCO|nr:hypothetical protein WICMUC_004330 [Wickerhamomyces mucosus]